MADSRCKRCDLIVGQCEHTRPSRPQVTPMLDEILVSPSGTAHVRTCPQIDANTDYSTWGLISHRPGTWDEIGGGRLITANAGGNPTLAASARCTDCVRLV